MQLFFGNENNPTPATFVPPSNHRGRVNIRFLPGGSPIIQPLHLPAGADSISCRTNCLSESL